MDIVDHIIPNLQLGKGIDFSSLQAMPTLGPPPFLKELRLIDKGQSCSGQFKAFNKLSGQEGNTSSPSKPCSTKKALTFFLVCSLLQQIPRVKPSLIRRLR